MDGLLVSGVFFFFSSRRRHTRYIGDWSSECALPICFAVRQRPRRVRGGDGRSQPDPRPDRGNGHRQIGRASCRERGDTPGGSGAFKKTRNESRCNKRAKKKMSTRTRSWTTIYTYYME